MLETPFSLYKFSDGKLRFGYCGPNRYGYTQNKFIEFLYEYEMSIIVFIFDELFIIKTLLNDVQYIIPKTLYGVYILQELTKKYTNDNT